jgi:hypothetical protein
MDLADPGNKPLSSAKVKRGARMTAARQRKYYVRGITLSPAKVVERPLHVASIDVGRLRRTAQPLLRVVTSGLDPRACANALSADWGTVCADTLQAVVLPSQMLFIPVIR